MSSSRLPNRLWSRKPIYTLVGWPTIIAACISMGGMDMADEPKRLTTKDFPSEVLTLFDKYIHGALDRRGFLEQAAKYAGSAVAATGMLAALAPDYARAQKIKPDDSRITTERVDVTSSQGVGTIKVYVAK